MENDSISEDYVHPKEHKSTILSIIEQFLLVSSSAFGLDSLMPVMFSLIHHCFRYLTVPHYELKCKFGFKVRKIANSVSLIMQTVCCTGLHTKGVHNNQNPKTLKTFISTSDSDQTGIHSPHLWMRRIFRLVETAQWFVIHCHWGQWME